MSRRARWNEGRGVRGLGAIAALAPAALTLAGCGLGPLTLNAPNIAPAAARDGTSVDLEPIAAGAAIVGEFDPPGPAAVLTAAMNGELRGRALHGGEAGGYGVRCTLDRFAVRTHATLTDGQEMLTLYADLSCEARRAQDGAVVWRGELRGRGCAEEPSVIGTDAPTTRRLLDRAMADVSREMASDLAVRALALIAAPSARVFADADQQRTQMGLDDSPFGVAALQETPADLKAVLRATNDSSAALRAAAWNAIAMAEGPGEPWIAGASLALDDDARVRFFQYKALARLGSASAMDQLRGASAKESDPLLSELLADALATGGAGVARSHR